MTRVVAFLLMIILAVLSAFGLPRKAGYDEAAFADGLPSLVTEGDVRVELLSETLVRIEAKGPKGFENRPSFTVQKRTGWAPVDHTERREGGFLLIETPRCTVHLPENAKSPAGCFITGADGAECWRFEKETDASAFLPAPSEDLTCWSFCDSPRVIPSERGYDPGVFLADNGWDLGNKATDVFVFLPGGDYRQLLSDFVDLTGRSEMLPLEMLGFWDSRYYEYTSETALQQVDDYRERGYPIDMLVIDTDWRNATSGAGYAVNKKDFPNLKQTFADLHAKGVSVVFNDHPEPMTGTNSLLDLPEVYFRVRNLKKLLGMGLDYWWYDRNWWTTLKPVDPDLSIYTSGMYAYYETTKSYYESVANGGFARRPAIMANVDGIGNGALEYASELAAHRYSLQWTGDVGTTAASLRKEIFNAVYGGIGMGLPYVSADLGGHTAEGTAEQYARWLQYGALSPIMRVHCTKPYSRMPWLFGDRLEGVAHTYIDMRYRLLPLFYALAHENYETGLPLLRRLDIDYPQYPESARNDAYLLGDSILVAPISDCVPAATDYAFTFNGQPGLQAEYFPNTELSGAPEITRIEPGIAHDWVFDAPEGLSVGDYFSARWTGELTIGAKPVFFRVMSDDGFRLWIDDEMVIDAWDVCDQPRESVMLPANTTHSIRAEFFDGNNHAHIYFDALSEGPVARDVFLPDGKWIDVWSGAAYEGPATVRVAHELETSPIFVRAGSVTALADNMESTKAGDWSHLTLDVYPGGDGSTVLYEDDGETVAYKDGRFRTTKITLSDGGAKLVIDPAQGAFDGSRAFDKRAYTVRIHTDRLAGVTLNGAALQAQKIDRDAAGKPFAVSGGSPDGDVYAVTFTADVNARSELIFRQ